MPTAVLIAALFSALGRLKNSSEANSANWWSTSSDWQKHIRVDYLLMFFTGSWCILLYGVLSHATFLLKLQHGSPWDFIVDAMKQFSCVSYFLTTQLLTYIGWYRQSFLLEQSRMFPRCLCGRNEPLLVERLEKAGCTLICESYSNTRLARSERVCSSSEIHWAVLFSLYLEVVSHNSSTAFAQITGKPRIKTRSGMMCMNRLKDWALCSFCLNMIYGRKIKQCSMLWTTVAGSNLSYIHIRRFMGYSPYRQGITKIRKMIGHFCLISSDGEYAAIILHLPKTGKMWDVIITPLVFSPPAFLTDHLSLILAYRWKHKLQSKLLRLVCYLKEFSWRP